MALAQVTVDHIHKTIQQVTDMWSAGLITDREFAKAIARVNTEYEENPATANEIDPNTGLKGKGI